MTGSGPAGRDAGDASAGLCAVCRHATPITSARGGAFLLCGLSKTDRRYPRYPGLPVLRCPGFEDRPAGSGAEEATR